MRYDGQFRYHDDSNEAHQVNECFKAVFKGDLAGLKGCLSEEKPVLSRETVKNLLDGRIVDARGRSLLQLAVFKRRHEVLRWLIERNALVSNKVQPNLNFTAIDEAILMNDMESVTMLMKSWLTYANEESVDKYTKLFKDFKKIGHLYAEFKIVLSPRWYLPFGFILPKETLKTYITENAIRIDMTIIGFNLTWKYSDHTLIIKRVPDKKCITYIHILHKKKIYVKHNLDASKVDELEKMALEKEERNADKDLETENDFITDEFLTELIDRRCKTPVVRLHHNLDDIVFTPYKSIWTSIRDTFMGPTSNTVQANEEADVTEYSVENIRVDLIRISDHFKARDAETAQNCEQINADGSKIDLLIKSHLNEVSEEQYFDCEKYNHVYRSEHTKVKHMNIKIHSWNSKRYLVLLDRFVIPVLDLFKEHHYMAEEIIKFLKSPKMPGFPVRMQIPILAIMGDFELKNLFNIDNTVPHVKNTGIESCEINDAVFGIPEGYTRVVTKEFYSNIQFNIADYLQKFNSTG